MPLSVTSSGSSVYSIPVSTDQSLRHNIALVTKNGFGLARKNSRRRQRTSSDMQCHPCNYLSGDEHEKNDCITPKNFNELSCDNTSDSPDRQPPLRFVFSGYSIWLELEQLNIDIHGRGDLDRAVMDAADHFHLGGAIPSPHVTALYGIDTISDDDEICRLFRDKVKLVLLKEAEKWKQERGDFCETEKLWPDLISNGIIVDVEFDGVNGGRMVSVMRDVCCLGWCYWRMVSLTAKACYYIIGAGYGMG